MALLELVPDFNEKNIIVWSKSLPQSHAFGYLYDSLVNGPVKFEPMAVWNDMQVRTAQGVYMGSGLLLPHARVKDISNSLLAIGLCPEGIPVEGKSEIARVVTMVLSPVDSPMAHTRLVGAIARLVLNQDFMQKLLNCACSKEVFDFVKNF